MAFDEAMIPSLSRHNVICQLIKDKPYKWGTNVFMTCCAETTYCLQLKVFCKLINTPMNLERGGYIPRSNH